MSHGQKTAATWFILIMIGAYLMDANVTHIISSFLSAMQQIHNQNAHP